MINHEIHKTHEMKYGLFVRVFRGSKTVESKPANSVSEDVACDECGSFGALEIGDLKLCAECVTLAGSACAGSASDDGD